MGIGRQAWCGIAFRTAVRAVVAMPVLTIILAMGRGNVPFEKALLSIRFDDAYMSQVPALDLLSTLGIRATVYSITGYIGTPSYMTWSDLLRLNSLGHEIGSHSESHRSMLLMTRASFEKQLLASRETLQKKGMPPASFAWPYGLRNMFHGRLVEKYYQNAVDYPLINAGGMNFRNSKHHELQSVVAHSVEEFENHLKRAVRTGAWMVVCFHRINGSGRFSTGMEEFSAMMKLAAAWRDKGLVDIVTVTEGAGRLDGNR